MPLFRFDRGVWPSVPVVLVLWTTRMSPRIRMRRLFPEGNKGMLGRKSAQVQH